MSVKIDGVDTPEGYEIVELGNLRASDLLLSLPSQEWGHPTSEDYDITGSDIMNYYSVARKIKASE